MIREKNGCFYGRYTLSQVQRSLIIVFDNLKVTHVLWLLWYYQACLPAPSHPLSEALTYICMCVCKYTHITAYVMPRADISRCQARKSRPGIAFQTLKLSSIKEVVFRGCVILRLSHNQFRFRFFIRFMCVMEFPTCVYKIW